ncbi:MAG: glutathione S-transferase N-terminal domain-containing protein, partial [Tabrizicola sp.]
MYTLHYAPDNASLIIRLVLDGAGIPYRTALVDRKRRQQDSPAYRALNPTGLIPTLETPQGAISETGAILQWLADTHRLAPDPGH